MDYHSNDIIVIILKNYVKFILDRSIIVQYCILHVKRRAQLVSIPDSTDSCATVTMVTVQTVVESGSIRVEWGIFLLISPSQKVTILFFHVSYQGQQ